MLSAWLPQTLWGWLGIVILVAVIIYHRALTWLGLMIGIAAFLYLYFFLDSSSSGNSASS